MPSDTGRPERPAGERRLRDELERIANQHPNPHDARWIRGASSALYALWRRAEQAEERLAERATAPASPAPERAALVERLERSADDCDPMIAYEAEWADVMREAAALLKGEQ